MNVRALGDYRDSGCFRGKMGQSPPRLDDGPGAEQIFL